MNPLLIRLGVVALVGAGAYLVGRVLFGRSAIVNCNRELRLYYDEYVRLSDAKQNILRGHRDTNRNRLKDKLKDTFGLTPLRFIIQGSYATDTIIQVNGNAYDIDDGVVFGEEQLVGARGGKLTSVQARELVRDVLLDERFNRQPEARQNCVRVYYNEGHHVDIPVYRQKTNWLGASYLELASSTWKRSDPEAVTAAYNDAVIEDSPDETNGRQMRRITRLIKAFAKSRSSWNMPSGFILSTLVRECYVHDAERDDVSFYETLKVVYERLQEDLSVWHPIAKQTLTMTDEEVCMLEFRAHLGEALERFHFLTEPDCTSSTAMAAWDWVFNTEFFSISVENTDESRQ